MCSFSRLLKACILVALGYIASQPAFASDAKATSQYGQKLGINEVFSRWPDGVVPYVYNTTGAAAEFTDSGYFIALLQDAMDEISDVANVTFQYNGIDDTASFDNSSDNMVVVGWEDIGGAAGRAGPSYSCFAQDIIDDGYCAYNDGTVKFNNDPNDVDWDASGNTDTMERKLVGVATHELLHLLGIGHSEEQISIMYADPYTNLQHLRDDDIEVLQSLYGAPETFVAPPTFTPPSAGANPFNSTIISDNDDTSEALATVTDAETAFYIGVRYEVNGPFDDTVEIVTQDPDGYYYQRNQADVSCAMGFICGGWLSAATVDAVKTYPGDWDFSIVVNDETVASLSIDADVNPARNATPTSALAFNHVRGVAPMRIFGRVDVTGDDDGDDTDITWHIPGDGATAVDFMASTGSSIKEVTFDDEGDHEVYVEVDDDWTRYGVPNSGSEAGPGFRDLYRQVFDVDKTLSDTVGLGDVNLDGDGDVAVLLRNAGGIPNRLLIVSGNDGTILQSRSVSDSDASVKDIRAIPDANADGINDVAVLVKNLIQGGVYIDITDPTTGTQIRRIFYEAAVAPLKIVVGATGTGLGAGVALGVLGETSNNRFRAQMKNGVTEALISKIYFDPSYYPQGVEVLTSIDADGTNDIAVLGVDSEGRVRVQIKDMMTGALEKLVYFDKRFLPIAFGSGIDVDGSTVEDLVVLGIDANGLIRAQIKDAFTGNRTGLVAFQKGYVPLDFVIVPDVGSPSLGVLGRNADGIVRVQLKNASTGSLESITRFDSANDPFGVAVVPDTNGSASELSVLGLAGNGNWKVQMKDAVSSAPLLNRVVP